MCRLSKRHGTAHFSAPLGPGSHINGVSALLFNVSRHLKKKKQKQMNKTLQLVFQTSGSPTVHRRNSLPPTLQPAVPLRASLVPLLCLLPGFQSPNPVLEGLLLTGCFLTITPSKKKILYCPAHTPVSLSRTFHFHPQSRPSFPGDSQIWSPFKVSISSLFQQPLQNYTLSLSIS